MKKNQTTTLAFCAMAGAFSAAVSAHAINTKTSEAKTFSYDLSTWSIPAMGINTWYHDSDDTNYMPMVTDSSTVAHISITVNATPIGTTGEGATVYPTSNPGVGIAYLINIDPTNLTTAEFDKSAPHELVFKNQGAARSGYVHVKYTMVRLTEQVPPGAIISAPSVTLHYKNVPPVSAYPDRSFVVLSGAVSAQPKMTTCTIDAPTEVKLPNLYGNALASGALLATDVPTVKLTNCPGAINGISYNLSAVYGINNAASSVLNTLTGSDYAQNVYIQVQNRDGTAFKSINNTTALNYTGSGSYDLPAFKVAYFINDASTVSVGKVSSALEVKLSYN